MTPIKYQLIDTPEAANRWLSGLDAAPCLGVDFEADAVQYTIDAWVGGWPS